MGREGNGSFESQFNEARRRERRCQDRYVVLYFSVSTKPISDCKDASSRTVMRADATHRLLLNSPLFKEFFIEVSNEKYVRFTIIEGSEPISYMARVSIELLHSFEASGRRANFDFWKLF